VKVQYNGGPLQGAVHWVGEEKGSQIFTINSEAEIVNLPLQVSGKCDRINREDGSCVDYAYVQFGLQARNTRPLRSASTFA